MFGLEQVLEQKKEIDSVVNQLKREYHLPSQGCTLADLSRITKAKNIQVDFCADAITAYNRHQKFPERSYIVLPNMRYPTNVRNCAHELGHIVLGTESELKVEYFVYRLTGENVISNHYLSALDALKNFFHFLVLRYSENPHCSEESWENLKQREVPESLIRLIESDYKELERALHILAKHLKESNRNSAK